MHRDTHMCAHMQPQVSSVMVTVISLSLETDISNNFLVFSFNMFFSVSSLQSKGEGSVWDVFVLVLFP